MKKSDPFKVAVPLGKYNLIYFTSRESKSGWKTHTPAVLDHTDAPDTVENWVMWLYDASIKKGHFEIWEAAEGKFTHRQFYCVDCSPRFGALCRAEYQLNGGTGYATLAHSEEKVCYDCCGTRDKQHMKDTGAIMLYLCEYGAMSSAEVSNWAGTLKYKVIRYRRSKHNIAGVRYDVWFRDDDNALWWGVQYGHNSQITRCRRIKEMRRRA